jgi:hypothetical protein
VDRGLAWSQYRLRRSGEGHDPGTSLELTPGTPDRAGRNSSVGTTTRYGLDGPGIESRWGTRFSAPVQTGSDAHPTSYTMGTGSLLGVKRPRRDVDHPSPSSAEVKERVELYLYSPYGPSWPVLG